MKNHLVLVGLFGLGGLCADVPRAAACSAFACQGAEAVVPVDGLVPANAPAMELLHAFEADVAVELLELGAGTAHGVSRAESLVMFDAPLVEGERYRLRAITSCETLEEPRIAEVEFEVGAAAPLPTALGALSAGDSTLGEVSQPASGSCFEPAAAAYVDIELTHPLETLPWKDVLVYHTYVDGEIYAPQGSIIPRHREGWSSEGTPPDSLLGGSWIGRGRDRIYAQCGESNGVNEGVGEGPHMVRMRATLPGTDLVLETAEIPIELSCDDTVTAVAAEPACSATGPAAATTIGWLVVATLAIARRRRR
jgi:uncharacterized protein (TIGR03382 family)